MKRDQKQFIVGDNFIDKRFGVRVEEKVCF